jgi:hypothetical protein
MKLQNSQQKSIQHAFIPPQNIVPLAGFKTEGYQDLFRLGIGLDEKNLGRMIAAMDAIQPTVTTGSMVTPLQFLQAWLPGFVHIITAARKIDEILGMSVVGSWKDEEVVQGVMELTGTAVPYGDLTNVPFSSWNVNFERRTIVRFEEGMRVGKLEAERAAAVRVDSAGTKRASAALALEVLRNLVGFFGYNAGANRTYGLLNDPGLPAYITVPPGGGGLTTWASKTFLEITADIRLFVKTLRTQSQDQIDPASINMTMVLPTSVIDYLSTTSTLGDTSVRDWLTKTYPKIRVVSAPEFVGANGGANAVYLFADTILDSSDDNRRVIDQLVPTKFQVVGVSQQTKAYEEDFTNALAGVICKRPWAVSRFSGV